MSSGGERPGRDRRAERAWRARPRAKTPHVVHGSRRSRAHRGRGGREWAQSWGGRHWLGGGWIDETASASSWGESWQLCHMPGWPRAGQDGRRWDVPEIDRAWPAQPRCSRTGDAKLQRTRGRSTAPSRRGRAAGRRSAVEQRRRVEPADETRTGAPESRGSVATRRGTI